MLIIIHANMYPGISLLIIILMHSVLTLQGQNGNSVRSFGCGDPWVDVRDGRIYNTVSIGDQCWLKENLNIGKRVDNFTQTDNGIIEKTCYDNDPVHCETYGGLYTWEEAMDYEVIGESRGICPAGWHIPSLEEWKKLDEFLGVDHSGTHMKVPPSHVPAWDGDNSSGFTALPSGEGYDRYFGRVGMWALYWSSTARGKDYAWFAQLDNYWALDKYTILYLGNYYLKSNGFSVRCIKDPER